MSLVVGNRGQRAAHVCAVASAIAPVAILPHVIEDASVGELDLFGLGLLPSGLLLGALLAMQLLGALGALRESRTGYLAVFVAATLWGVGAILDHPDAFLTGEFRTGLASRAGIWALVATQFVAAAAALSAMRATRKTSFTGTGTYTKRGR